MQFYELSSLFAIKSGRVTEADLVPLIEGHYGSGGIVIPAISIDDSTADSDDWVASGQAIQGQEIAMNLLKNVSPALLPTGFFPAKVDTGWCVLSLDRDESDCSITFFSKNTTHRIESLREFTQYISDKDYSSALFSMKPIMKRDASEGPIALEELVGQNLGDFEEDGTWFDSDDDWGYTEWSTLFNSWGYQNPDRYTAWCIRMEDFEKQILNWSKTTLDELLAFINAKV